MRDSNASSPSSSLAGVDCHSVVTLAVRYLISGETKGSSDERKDDSSQARRRRLRGSGSAIASTPGLCRTASHIGGPAGSGPFGPRASTHAALGWIQARARWCSATTGSSRRFKMDKALKRSARYLAFAGVERSCLA
jgi:hypothetical protein